MKRGEFFKTELVMIRIYSFIKKKAGAAEN